VTSLPGPEEDRVGARGDALLDVIDPVVGDLDVGVQLDEVRRGGQAVDVPDREELEVAIAVRAVPRRVQHVVQPLQLAEVGLGQERRSEVHFPERMEPAEKRLQHGDVLRAAADEDIQQVLVVLHPTPFRTCPRVTLSSHSGKTKRAGPL
jgi:hypothetical protein